jgi:hypothetical protein
MCGAHRRLKIFGPLVALFSGRVAGCARMAIGACVVTGHSIYQSLAAGTANSDVAAPWDQIWQPIYPGSGELN